MRFATTKICRAFSLLAALFALAGCDRLTSKHEQEADPSPAVPAVIQSAEVTHFDGGMSLEGVALVLNPDPLLQLDADLKTATIAADFSAGQLDRFKQTKSLSIQTVASAERQAQADETQVHLLQNRLTQTWGKTAPFIAEEARTALIPDLSRGVKALVRLDVPEMTPEKPKNVRIASLQEGSEKPALAMWDAPSGSQAMPGSSYFALIETAPGLRPGDRARLLADRAETLAGTIVPSSAIVIHEGQAWCYVETSAKTYERRRVSLEHPLDDGYVASSGFPAGTRVVIRGASVLLAREAGPGEDDDDGGGKSDGGTPAAKPAGDDDKRGAAAPSAHLSESKANPSKPAGESPKPDVD